MNHQKTRLLKAALIYELRQWQVAEFYLWWNLFRSVYAVDLATIRHDVNYTFHTPQFDQRRWPENLDSLNEEIAPPTNPPMEEIWNYWKSQLKGELL